jgi:hypothetical protein
VRVTVRWHWLEDEGAPEWDATNCLFAFADPESDEILYVGAAAGATVRDRCEAAELEPLWSDLRGIGVEHVSVMVGTIDRQGATPEPARNASAAAALLVAELQPSGNAVDATAVPPAGLEVECAGDWPYEESRFAS